ncbi:MAG TPA: aminotransferase class IV [Flavisolibacter sp.]|nr:aminotransferase class IV [Flavisolibacter sp.]
MTQWTFLNGEFVEEEKTVLSFRDLSFLRGYGVFDFLRLIGQTPLFLEDHLDRFFYSAKGLHLPVPFHRDEIKTAIFELIERNNLTDTGIRLSLTGGHSEDGFNIGSPNFIVSQHSFTSPTEMQVKNGIRLLSYPYQRPLPEFKSIDYQMAIWLQPERIRQNADDILYVKDGLISECPRSNFFLMTENKTIVTPVRNALAGITQKKVIAMARQHFAVEQRPVSYEEIFTAREAFITSTTKQILPVAQIDEKRFSHTSVAQHLLHLFRSAYGCR